MKSNNGRGPAAADAASADAEQEWAHAWSGRYGGPSARRRGSVRVGPGKVAVLVGALLGLVIAPLAIAQGEGSSDDPQATAAATGDVLREGVRNPRRGAARRETSLIAGNRGYALRESNLLPGGGGAIHGVRSAAGGTPAGQLPGVRASNLRDGLAFEFQTATGDVAGTIQKGNDLTAVDTDAVPFQTNMGGLVENLNAQRVGGLTATQLANQPSPPTGPAGGDLTGNYPNPAIAANAVNTSKLGNAAVRAANLGTIIQVADSESVPDGAHAPSASVQCPAGTRVISGGGFIAAGANRTLLTTIRSGNGWFVRARNDSGAARTLIVRAYCLVA